MASVSDLLALPQLSGALPLGPRFRGDDGNCASRQSEMLASTTAAGGAPGCRPMATLARRRYRPPVLISALFQAPAPDGPEPSGAFKAWDQTASPAQVAPGPEVGPAAAGPPGQAPAPAAGGTAENTPREAPGEL